MTSHEFAPKYQSASALVMNDIEWGRPDVLYTPAYWKSQVMALNRSSKPFTHRLGATLAEEIAACLLGGYGVPAEVGLAAFQKLKNSGVLKAASPLFEHIEHVLSEPLAIGARRTKYRFAKQRAKYIYESLRFLSAHDPPLYSGRVFRDWLIQLPGVGLKTASWVSRNWLESDDVAIIDIHIYRAGLIMGLFPHDWGVAKHYLDLENRFLEFAQKLGVRTSLLDAVIWQHMRESNELAIRLINIQMGRSQYQGYQKVA